MFSHAGDRQIGNRVTGHTEHVGGKRGENSSTPSSRLACWVLGWPIGEGGNTSKVVRILHVDDRTVQERRYFTLDTPTIPSNDTSRTGEGVWACVFPVSFQKSEFACGLEHGDLQNNVIMGGRKMPLSIPPTPVSTRWTLWRHSASIPKLHPCRLNLNWDFSVPEVLHGTPFYPWDSRDERRRVLRGPANRSELAATAHG